MQKILGKGGIEIYYKNPQPPQHVIDAVANRFVTGEVEVAILNFPSDPGCKCWGAWSGLQGVVNPLDRVSWIGPPWKENKY